MENKQNVVELGSVSELTLGYKNGYKSEVVRPLLWDKHHQG